MEESENKSKGKCHDEFNLLNARKEKSKETSVVSVVCIHLNFRDSRFIQRCPGRRNGLLPVGRGEGHYVMAKVS